jgi:hypothetical protein
VGRGEALSFGEGVSDFGGRIVENVIDIIGVTVSVF